MFSEKLISFIFLNYFFPQGDGKNSPRRRRCANLHSCCILAFYFFKYINPE